MTKKKIIITAIILLVIIAPCIFMKIYLRNKEIKHEAEVLYSRQNEAFCISMEESYFDYSNVNKSLLICNLAAYEYRNPGKHLSLEEVEEYLSSEYDENGECVFSLFGKLVPVPKLLEVACGT